MTKEAETTPETLENISFELITKLLNAWRTPKKHSFTFKSKHQEASWKFNAAIKLHSIIIDAMRFHPDLRRLAELHRVAEEVEQELAVARKIHPILARTENPNSNTGS